MKTYSYIKLLSASLLLIIYSFITDGISQKAFAFNDDGILVPQNFVLNKDIVFFSLDKQGSKGTVEKVISDYNKYIVGKVSGFDVEAQTKADLLDKNGQSFNWELKMDIIHPQITSTPRPVIIFISTSTERNLARYQPFQKLFAQKGYVTVFIDHAYSPLARIFGHDDAYYSLDEITGVKAYTAAVRYLRANATALSIDPDRIGGLVIPKVLMR